MAKSHINMAKSHMGVFFRGGRIFFRDAEAIRSRAGADAGIAIPHESKQSAAIVLMYLNYGLRYDREHPPKRLPLELTWPWSIRRGKSDMMLVPKTLPPRRVNHDYRVNWEFYAVVKGALGMVPAGGEPTGYPLKRRTLWVSPPNSCHWFRCKPGEVCGVVVFHFSSIPPILEDSLGKEQAGNVQFTPRDAGQLWAICSRVLPDYERPNFISPLAFDSALCELSSFFLHRMPSLKVVSAFDPNAHKVNVAMHWFRAHLSRGADIEDVAQAMGITTGHMRRLFLEVHGRPPKDIFTGITMDLARSLLTKSELSLKEVATRCGFKAYSQFYRAFERHTGTTPADWFKGNTYGQETREKMPIFSQTGARKAGH